MLLLIIFGEGSSAFCCTSTTCIGLLKMQVLLSSAFFEVDVEHYITLHVFDFILLKCFVSVSIRVPVLQVD